MPIALLQLAEPVEGVEPVALNSQNDEVGQLITFVGTGDTGTGLTGPTTMDGKKRGASNTVDAVDDDWIFFTFNRGDAATDLEGVSGPGDSGGPALLERDGKLYTLGVSVFSDGGGKGPGRYGIREGYTRVSTHRKWIRAVLAGKKNEREIAIGSGAKRKMARGTPGGGGRAVVVGGAPEIPDTPFGAVVREYVETYNRNDDASMWAFIGGHFEEEFRASKSEQEHVGLYRRLFDEHFGKLTLRGVIRDDADGLTLLVDSARGRTAEFRFDAGTENRITGMQVAIVEISRD